MTRNPMEVTESMNRRDTLDQTKALGVWFNYNISALNDTAGVPAVFVSYDEFLADWEKSLRRCAMLPGLAWPADDRRLREAMSASIRPDLRHHRSATAELQTAPRPVEELYGLLCRAGSQQGVRDRHFEAEVRRLTGDFKAWAATLPELMLDLPRPGRLKCTWLRWRKSFRKRFRRGA
jgi:hypothetical protein